MARLVNVDMETSVARARRWFGYIKNLGPLATRCTYFHPDMWYLSKSVEASCIVQQLYAEELGLA